MKRLYCLILALIFAISLLPASAMAEGELTCDAVDCDSFFQEGAYEGPQEPLKTGATLFFGGEDLETLILTCMAQVHAGTVSPTDLGDVWAVPLDIEHLGLYNTQESQNAIDEAYSGAVNSNPKYFYFESSFTYSYYTDSYLIATLYMYINYDFYQQVGAFDAELARMEEEAVPAAIRSGLTDTHKALLVHDYLALNLRYDYEALSLTQTDTDFLAAHSAYGPVINKRAVCQGYALCYIAMLQDMGVDACYVGSTDNYHAWNMVTTEAGIYHVDVTFDDPGWGQADLNVDGDSDWRGYVSHAFFLLTDAAIQLDITHDIWDDATLTSASTEHPNSGFWDGVESGMFYCAGNWYYLDSGGAHPFILLDDSDYRYSCGNLCSSPYGTSRTQTQLATDTSLPVYWNQKVFYYTVDSDPVSTLYAYDAAHDETDVIGDAVIDPGELLTEMHVQSEKLCYLAVDPEHHTYASREYALTETAYYGDMDQDGDITAADLTCLMRHVMGADVQTDPGALARADVNGDGRVTLTDAAFLCRYLAGSIVVFPAD